MDTLTHIALGACLGETILNKQLGKRALWLGAIAQSIPDIDFLASLWASPTENLLVHRGFTHSIFFVLIITPLLSYLSDRWYRPHNVPLKKWIVFWGIQGFLHIFLDGFNAYGVGWLEPFSGERFSFNTIFVADPYFSIAPGIALVILIILKKDNRQRIRYWAGGLLLSSMYLVYSVSNKLTIDHKAAKLLHAQGINYQSYYSSPTPLNIWLWYIVAGDKNGYYISFRSVFDHSDKLALQYFPKNESLLNNVSDHRAVRDLVRFSQGFYTIEKQGDSITFSDLRFGQVNGWAHPKNDFVFRYSLQPDAANKLTLQRGRLRNWDKASVVSFFHRIMGE